MSARICVVGTGTVAMAALRRSLADDNLDVRSVIGRTEAAGAAVSDAFSSARTSREVPYDTDLLSSLEREHPDAVLIATRTRLADVVPDIETCLASGAAVLCTSEELAYPDPDDSHTGRLLAASRSAGRPIVAVGVNPGFVFDTVPVWLAAGKGPVRSLTVRRTVDAGVFGARVQAGLGIGVTPQEFDAGVAAGAIRGHVGFPESANVIARHLGRAIVRSQEFLTPIIRGSEDSPLPSSIETGRSVGVSQIARFWCDADEAPWLSFELDLHVAPLSAGWTLRDEVSIDDGEVTTWTASPSPGAISTTASLLVNLVRPALLCGAGLMTPVDLVGRREGI